MSALRRNAYELLIRCLTDTPRWVRLITESQTWSAAEISDYQVAAMQRVRAWAMETDFYRRRSGSCAGDSRYLTDFPVLKRGEIAALFRECRPRADLSVREFATGGSSGQPIRVLQDQAYVDAARAVSLIFDRWSGYRPGDRRVMLWGSLRDLGLATATLKSRLYTWIKNDHWVNGFKVDLDTVRRLCKELDQGCDLLLGYSSSLDMAASVAFEKQIEFKAPKAIMSSAGTLTASMLANVRRAFSAPVANRYGSRECGDMACTCNFGNLHFCPVTSYVEVVAPAGPSTQGVGTGGILITSLLNRTMPLIRYEIGDLATALRHEKCACGLEWPWVESIDGRLADALVSRSGARIAPQYFIHVLGVELDSSVVSKYQVVQRAGGDIELNYVLRSDEQCLPQEVRERIRTFFTATLGAGTPIEFVQKDDIAPLASGKYQYVRRE
jgi:phenylacetate-CoA ligase